VLCFEVREKRAATALLAGCLVAIMKGRESADGLQRLGVGILDQRWFFDELRMLCTFWGRGRLLFLD